jgi:phosphoglycerate dehydrogenase-like enzyme
MPEKIKVLVHDERLSEALVQQIRNISDRIEVAVARDNAAALKAVNSADVVYGRFTKEMFLAAKKLRWIQTKSAGVDRLLFPELVNSDVVLTNARIHGTQIAEMIVAMMLVFMKKIHRFMQYKAQAKWQRQATDDLFGKTVGILGLGTIGSETARKAKCLGMKVVAFKKHQTPKPAYVDELLGPEGLARLLRQSDFVVVALPLTKETRHMIGEEQLQMMKPNAYIVNVSRGAVVNTAALIKALKEGWIAGAGLDVFEQEPLPEDSELWKLDNVVMTPHVSGGTPRYDELAVGVLCDNLRRYVEGKPLRNVVNKKAGY